MSFDADTLYGLLPAIHRARDQQVAQRTGADTGPLRQLVGLLAEQIAALDESLDQLYDDQFIETCAAWVVPYIGDLVGYAPIRSEQGSIVPRAEVANTIRWRRAKGTVRAVEGVARDVSGRDVIVAESFKYLSTTANLNHIRPGVGTASLRDPTAFADPDGPFDATPHTVEARTVATGGRWGLPNLVCFLWPWRAAWRPLADPTPVDTQRFLFHPLGIDGPLLNQPAAAPSPPSGASDVAVRLRLRDDPGPAGDIARSVAVLVGGSPQAFSVGDLSDTTSDPDTATWAHMPASGIAIDPERGRIAFAAAPAGAVQVGFWYPAVGLLGGGAYARAGGFDSSLGAPVEIGAGETLAAVLADPKFTGDGAIEIASNARLAAAGLPATITVAAGKKLEIRAADGDWPVMLLGQTLMLEGGAGSELVLDGVVVQGAGIQIPAIVNGAANGLQRVTLRNCTVTPGFGLSRAGAPLSPGAVSVTCAAPDTVLVLSLCVTGPVQAVTGGQLRISDCVIDAGNAASPALFGPASAGPSAAAPCGSLWIYNATVRGTVQASLLALASNTLFLGAVGIQQLQSGLVRFSSVPAAYAGPRQYSCVDASATPVFRSWQLGSADYARLSASAPAVVLTGADDGGEIGAFHGARDTAIEDGIAVRLGEYTRFALDSGLRHAGNA